MRYRRVSNRYAELVGEISRAFGEQSWEFVRPRAVASPYFRPAVDVVETLESYLVIVELPGVDEDDIDIFVHPDALVVSGRRRCIEVEGARWHAAEIRYGAFRFCVPLPADADPDAIAASAARGLLRISIQKRVRGIA